MSGHSLAFCARSFTRCAIALSAPMVLTFVLTAFASSAQSVDSDADGISDELEMRLGTHLKVPEQFILIYDDKAKGAGDKSISSAHKLAPDVTKIYVAHVGDRRFVFKIEFATDYDGRGNVFHLYVDFDDDKETGRQDKEFARGVDIMYSFVDGKQTSRVINPDVRVSSEIPIRQFIAKNAIYVCDDVRPKIVNGRTHFRIYILSHRRQPTADSDVTPWIYVTIPVNPKRRAPKPSYPRRRNFECLPAWYELLYTLWQDERTVRLLQRDAEVIGLTKHTNDEFEGRGDANESAIWTSPASGDYYIALILRSSNSAWEALDVRVNGKTIGTVAGALNRNVRLLFFTKRKVRIRKGDRIEITQSSQPTPVRFSDVALLATKPKVPKLRIENATACVLPPIPGEAHERWFLTWVTNRPTRCTVRYESLRGNQVRGKFETGDGARQLHFIELPRELHGLRLRVRIVASEPKAMAYKAQTARHEFVIETKRVPKGNFKRTEIQLTVREPTKWQRDGWWVTAGIPLPDGLLPSEDRCALFNSQGDAIPAQFRALSYWRSGCVKWLLCDFLANTQPNTDTHYALLCNVNAPKVQTSLTVHEANDVVIIRTGRLVCMLSKSRFAPFAHIGIDRNSDGKLDGDERITMGSEHDGAFFITDADGNVYSTAHAKPDEIVIEESGPVRATVRIRGAFADARGRKFMRYLCRMHFYAGKPWMRIVFSIDNDNASTLMSLVNSANARIPMQLDGARFSFGIGESGVINAEPVRLLQDYDNHYSITTLNRDGKRARGFAWMRNNGFTVLAVVRNFWQLYPKAFTIARDGLRIELLPKLPPDQYEREQKDADLLTRLFFWCDRGRYKLRYGVRITTEMWLDFDAPTNVRDAIAEAEHVQKPLFATASPEWYCRSGVVGMLHPRRKGWFDAYEVALDRAFKDFLKRRERIREYGFINYGDWFGERTWNWGNAEYDTPWSLALNFMRTGNLEMLWRGDEAEWHHGDIDVVHYGDVGKVWAHSVGHTGGYFPRDWKGMGGFNAGASSWGHTWCRGHFALWALTGEWRYYDNGVIVANRIARTATNFDFYSERDGGWRILSLVGAYQFTGNAVYLNAAKLMVDVAVWKLHPERGMWGHFIGECKHEPRHWGAKPFMTGILLHGLRLYDLEQPREDVKRTIMRNCDFLWRECYIRKDNGFIYAQCSSFWDRGSTWTIWLVGDGLAYGCLIDTKRRHKELLIRAVAGNIYKTKVGSFGKTFSQATCFYPYLLHDLVELGITDIKPPK